MDTAEPNCPVTNEIPAETARWLALPLVSSRFPSKRYSISSPSREMSEAAVDKVDRLAESERMLESPVVSRLSRMRSESSWFSIFDGAVSGAVTGGISMGANDHVALWSDISTVDILSTVDSPTVPELLTSSRLEKFSSSVGTIEGGSASNQVDHELDHCRVPSSSVCARTEESIDTPTRKIIASNKAEHAIREM